MELKILEHELTVCKVASVSQINSEGGFYFIGKTDEEISLVCPTQDTPAQIVEREDGWRGFRVQGVLDFSLVGILAEISAVLAHESISIFAVSTFNTDYILVKSESLERAVNALKAQGFSVV